MSTPDDTKSHPSDVTVALGGFSAALSWVESLDEIPSASAIADVREKYKAYVEAHPHRLGFPISPDVMRAELIEDEGGDA
ncbi:MAG TPA: hypothetical protein VGH09_12545 [Solirubrobacteraceae bacterium]